MYKIHAICWNEKNGRTWTVSELAWFWYGESALLRFWQRSKTGQPAMIGNTSISAGSASTTGSGARPNDGRRRAAPCPLPAELMAGKLLYTNDGRLIERLCCDASCMQATEQLDRNHTYAAHVWQCHPISASRASPHPDMLIPLTPPIPFRVPKTLPWKNLWRVLWKKCRDKVKGLVKKMLVQSERSSETNVGAKWKVQWKKCRGEVKTSVEKYVKKRLHICWSFLW